VARVRPASARRPRGGTPPRSAQHSSTKNDDPDLRDDNLCASSRGASRAPALVGLEARPFWLSQTESNIGAMPPQQNARTLGPRAPPKMVKKRCFFFFCHSPVVAHQVHLRKLAIAPCMPDLAPLGARAGAP